MGRKIVLHNLDGGELGIAKHTTEPSNGNRSEYVNIIFKPYGFLGILRKGVIENVLKKGGLIKVIPPDTTKPGVPDEIWYVTLTNGRSRIFDEIDRDKQDNVARIQQEKAALEMELAAKESTIKELGKTAKDHQKMLMDMQRPRRRKDVPFPSGKKKSNIAEELEEMEGEENEW